MSATPADVPSADEFREGWAGRGAGDRSPGGWPLSVSSGGLVNQLLVKAGAGTLFGFTARSARVSAQFILLFDLSASPASGAVPAMAYDIATVSTLGVAFTPYGRAFSRGCVLCNSTTAATLTLGAADTLLDVQFE